MRRSGDAVRDRPRDERSNRPARLLPAAGRRAAQGGERVTAVVEPARWTRAGSELEAELGVGCRPRRAGDERPRSFDVVPHLPRLPGGEPARGELRDPDRRRRTTRVP